MRSSCLILMFDICFAERTPPPSFVIVRPLQLPVSFYKLISDDLKRHGPELPLDTTTAFAVCPISEGSGLRDASFPGLTRLTCVQTSTMVRRSIRLLPVESGRHEDPVNTSQGEGKAGRREGKFGDGCYYRTW